MEITSLRKLPVMKPMNDHRADLSACSCFFPAYFSPRYAQRNGHHTSQRSPNGQIVIHKIGRIMTAIISQILLPRTPRLVPQNFLVHRDGMI